jgi:hypothetical protein
MRLLIALSLVAFTSLAGCGDGVSRWSGEGCQPACLANPGDGTQSIACVTADHELEPCQQQNESLASCLDADGRPTCDTKDGKPRCPSDERPKPVCGR